MTDLLTTPVTADLVRGCLETEQTADGLLPHRLPAWARAQNTDPQLEMAQLLRARERDTALLNLYRERIGLLDALMDVHVTRASNVGL